MKGGPFEPEMSQDLVMVVTASDEHDENELD